MSNNLNGLFWQSFSIWCLQICYLKLSLHFVSVLFHWKHYLMWDLVMWYSCFVTCSFLIFLLNKYKWERIHPIIEFIILPVEKQWSKPLCPPCYFAESKPFWYRWEFLFIVTGTHKLLKSEPGWITLIKVCTYIYD